MNSTFCEKRIRRIPWQFNENTVDQRLQDSVKSFQVIVFKASIDIMVTQLESRFTGAEAVAATFQCLSPQFLSADCSTDEVVLQSAASLATTPGISPITSRHSFCLSVHYLTTIKDKWLYCSRIGRFPYRAKLFHIANVPTSVHGFFAVLDIASRSCYCRKELFKAKVY